MEFERLYNEDAPLTKVLPKLAEVYPDRYDGYTLQQLCQEMHQYYRVNKTFTLQKELFSKPNMQDYQMTPAQADQLFMRNQSELVDLQDIKGRTAVEGALPYPPGVFIVAPGEKWSDIDLKYFEVLVGAIEQFPGFVPEIQGVYWDADKNGKISVQAEVLKNK